MAGVSIPARIRHGQAARLDLKTDWVGELGCIRLPKPLKPCIRDPACGGAWRLEEAEAGGPIWHEAAAGLDLAADRLGGIGCIEVRGAGGGAGMGGGLDWTAELEYEWVQESEVAAVIDRGADGAADSESGIVLRAEGIAGVGGRADGAEGAGDHRLVEVVIGDQVHECIDGDRAEQRNRRRSRIGLSDEGSVAGPFDEQGFDGLLVGGIDHLGDSRHAGRSSQFADECTAYRWPLRHCPQLCADHEFEAFGTGAAGVHDRGHSIEDVLEEVFEQVQRRGELREEDDAVAIALELCEQPVE